MKTTRDFYGKDRKFRIVKYTLCDDEFSWDYYTIYEWRSSFWGKMKWMPMLKDNGFEVEDFENLKMAKKYIKDVIKIDKKRKLKSKVVYEHKNSN